MRVLRVLGGSADLHRQLPSPALCVESYSAFRGRAAANLRCSASRATVTVDAAGTTAPRQQYDAGMVEALIVEGQALPEGDGVEPSIMATMSSREGGMCTHAMQGRSCRTIDPRIPSMPERSTSTGQTLHQGG